MSNNRTWLAWWELPPQIEWYLTLGKWRCW